ncbi:hypothetical protein [Nitrincola schmidtii]|uniref:hypothetical protein n=1 Tax=Nitrincola schmidtii TaxID=1730894 RepID=UPI00124EEC3C|nr:hypothetical protein [Nitrincola schmidtii]
MPVVDFYFSNTNLNAVASHLKSLSVSQFDGQAIHQIESQLVTASIDMFASRYCNLSAVSAQTVNQGELHAAVLWKGIGAIFSASEEVTGSGVLIQQQNLNVQVTGQYVVRVALWAYLD